MALAVEDYVATKKEDATADIVGDVCIKPYSIIAPVQFTVAVGAVAAGSLRSGGGEGQQEYTQ